VQESYRVNEYLVKATPLQVSIYKIWFPFKALLWESIILILPPPPPTKPTLLHYYCTTIAQYTPPPPPTIPFHAIHHTILVMAISCKGQSTGATPGAAVNSGPLSKGLSAPWLQAFALTWYRALIWYSLRLSPPRTHFEPWKAVSTRGRGSLAVR